MAACVCCLTPGVARPVGAAWGSKGVKGMDGLPLPGSAAAVLHLLLLLLHLSGARHPLVLWLPRGEASTITFWSLKVSLPTPASQLMAKVLFFSKLYLYGNLWAKDKHSSKNEQD